MSVGALGIVGNMGVIPEFRVLISMPYGQEKKRLVQGNWDLAAYLTFNWYDRRSDYIAERRLQTGQDPETERMGAYYGELDELQKVRAQTFEQLIAERDHSVSWEHDKSSNRIWSLASEHADVHIVAASILREKGWGLTEVADLWRGKKMERETDEWLASYVRFLSQSRNELERLGVDLAEAIMAKLEQNDLHYEWKLWPIMHVNPLAPDGKPWSRHMRGNIGDPDNSQIPSLVQEPMGEGILATIYESPFGSNGYKPTAIKIVDGIVQVAPTDRDNDYGLYATGRLGVIAALAGE